MSKRDSVADCDAYDCHHLRTEDVQVREPTSHAACKPSLFKGLVSALGSGPPPAERKASSGHKQPRSHERSTDLGSSAALASASSADVGRKSGRYCSAAAEEYDPSAIYEPSLGIFKPLSVRHVAARTCICDAGSSVVHGILQGVRCGARKPSQGCA